MRIPVRGLALSILILLALPFALYSVQRGVAFGTPTEQDSRFIIADAMLSSGLLYLHMVAGGLLTVLTVWQLFEAPRRRWPLVHRVGGRMTLGLAAIAAVGGLAFIASIGTIGGWVMDLGFALYGTLLLGAGVATWRSAVTRAPSHPDWAARLVVLALGSWLYRVQYGIWELATGGIGRAEDFTGPFDRVQVFAFYLPWLIALELWLAAQKRGMARQSG